MDETLLDCRVEDNHQTGVVGVYRSLSESIRGIKVLHESEDVIALDLREFQFVPTVTDAVRLHVPDCLRVGLASALVIVCGPIVKEVRQQHVLTRTPAESCGTVLQFDSALRLGCVGRLQCLFVLELVYLVSLRQEIHFQILLRSHSIHDIIEEKGVASLGERFLTKADKFLVVFFGVILAFHTRDSGGTKGREKMGNNRELFGK